MTWELVELSPRQCESLGSVSLLKLSACLLCFHMPHVAKYGDLKALLCLCRCCFDILMVFWGYDKPTLLFISLYLCSRVQDPMPPCLITSKGKQEIISPSLKEHSGRGVGEVGIICSKYDFSMFDWHCHSHRSLCTNTQKHILSQYITFLIKTPLFLPELKDKPTLFDLYLELYSIIPFAVCVIFLESPYTLRSKFIECHSLSWWCKGRKS